MPTLGQKFTTAVLAVCALAAQPATAARPSRLLAPSDRLTTPAPRRLAEAAEVRYVEADTRQEALQRLAPLTAAGRPSALIEVPGSTTAVKYGPCWLHPHRVHLRKSGSWSIVGAKPETRCNRTVSVIRHETTLRYAWYIWWLQAGRRHVEQEPQTSGFQSLEYEFNCRGREMTTWTGTTLGIVIYRGHRYYARAYHGVQDLACSA